MRVYQISIIFFILITFKTFAVIFLVLEAPDDRNMLNENFWSPWLPRVSVCYQAGTGKRLIVTVLPMLAVDDFV